MPDSTDSRQLSARYVCRTVDMLERSQTEPLPTEQQQQNFYLAIAREAAKCLQPKLPEDGSGLRLEIPKSKGQATAAVLAAIAGIAVMPMPPEGSDRYDELSVARDKIMFWLCNLADDFVEDRYFK